MTDLADLLKRADDRLREVEAERAIVEHKLKQTEERLAEAERRAESYRANQRTFWSEFAGEPWPLLGMLIVLAVVVFLCTLIGQSVFASGEVDYCYTNRSTYYQTDEEGRFLRENGRLIETGRGVALVGHRSWREDRTIGDFPSVEAALEVANKMGCRMGVEK